MIRAATHADIPRLVDMGGQFIRSSRYFKRLADNRQARADLMRRLINQSDGAIFVSEKDGEITGMIGVCAYMHPWSGELISCEMFWWVDPKARGHGVKLLKRAEDWMNDKGCVRSQMITPDERVGRVYQRLGYSKLEEVWQRDL